MSLSFSRAFLCAVGIACSIVAQSVNAQAPGPGWINKVLAPGCINSPKGKVHNPRSDANIPHQYMLLLIFKKGQGSQYFGGATDTEYGCIPDVPSALVVAPPSQLMAENCPNDCVYPYGKRPATDNGNDPLNVDPQQTNRWGILSAVDSKSENGGAKRHVEIWQVAAIDACHARKLYAHHTKDASSVFSQAYRKGHLLGEVMVGYPAKGNGNERSQPCQAL
ncbi:MAG: hypothetical protein WKG03_04020 [Telluria sp.]